jgi:hypothetical protein
MPCMLYMLILAICMFYKFHMINYVPKYLETLGLRFLGSKIPFLSVLDCHYSPWRAITRHGELEGRMGGTTRPQLATASSYSPRRASLLARRVDSAQCTVCSFRVSLACPGSRFLQAVFYKSKPLKPRS